MSNTLHEQGSEQFQQQIYNKFPYGLKTVVFKEQRVLFWEITRNAFPVPAALPGLLVFLLIITKKHGKNKKHGTNKKTWCK